MRILTCTVIALSSLTLGAAAAELPDAIAVSGKYSSSTMNAVGAQVYECKLNGAGKLVWQFREPIATLFLAGQTVGRHYAGPSWEMNDGSVVTAQVSGRAPAATPADIPLLKLDVTSGRGKGRLSGVAIIQRVNTIGGVREGGREDVGSFLSVPYSADYVFHHSTDDNPSTSRSSRF
jgi:Protein of unknown function (DUF3455)